MTFIAECTANTALPYSSLTEIHHVLCVVGHTYQMAGAIYRNYGKQYNSYSCFISCE